MHLLCIYVFIHLYVFMQILARCPFRINMHVPFSFEKTKNNLKGLFINLKDQETELYKSNDTHTHTCMFYLLNRTHVLFY